MNIIHNVSTVSEHPPDYRILRKQIVLSTEVSVYLEVNRERYRALGYEVKVQKNETKKKKNQYSGL